MNRSPTNVHSGLGGGRRSVANVIKPSTGSSLFRFLQLSGFSFVLNLGLTILLHETCHLPTELAYAMALLTVLATNFAVMRWYVFPHSEHTLTRQASGFAVSSVLFRGLEYVTFLLLHSLLGLAYIAAIVSVTGLAFVAKFSFYRQCVFGSRSAIES